MPQSGSDPPNPIPPPSSKPERLDGFTAIKENNFAKFDKVLNLVKEIKEVLLQKIKPNQLSESSDPATANDSTSAPATANDSATATATGGGTNGEKKENGTDRNYGRAVEMLDTDIKYIKTNITELEKTPNKKRADVLLQFLMEATDRRTAKDFTESKVNLKKLLQIIAKLKLWVPPVIPEDTEDPASKDAEKKKKKEESPFVSRKEKDKAATDVVKELFGLRCSQWGMDGLLKSYGELSTSEKLGLLCFSGFKCKVDKDDKGDMKSSNLEIKKRILTHWWVGEGIIDLHRAQLEAEAAKVAKGTVGESIPKGTVRESIPKGTVEEVGESIRTVGESIPKGTVGESIPKATVGESIPKWTVEEVGESIRTVGESIPKGTVGESIPKATVRENIPKGTVEKVGESIRTVGESIPKGTVGESIPKGTVGENIPKGTVEEGGESIRTVGESIPKETVGESIPKATVRENIPKGTVEEVGESIRTVGESIPKGTVGESMTVEEVGFSILKVLIEKGFIEPVMSKARESSRVMMHPFVHSFVTALAKRAGFFDISGKDGMMSPSFGLSQRACLVVKSAEKVSSCRQWEALTDDRDKLKRFEAVQTLFNVNEPIIDIKPEWFSRMTNLVVLHLGSWKSEPEAVEHIEVEDVKFLDDLKLMGKLKLFSLQGVSTVMKLTDSVCNLENLVILDLRECHNLEELPPKIGSLRSLTHLDITNCHLLTNLPIGISLLSNVEVLKGFVIYDQDRDHKARKNCWRKTKGCVIHDVFGFKNKDICRLEDLEKLEKLRQLSLVVNTDEFPFPEDVKVFEKMTKLTKLKISWEKSFKDKKNKNQENSSKNQEDSNASQDTSNQGEANALQPPSSQGDNKALEQPPSQGDTKGSKYSSGKCGWCSSAVNKPDPADAGGRQEGETRENILSHIKKLELWCYPKKDAPYWLHPKQLKNLEKLYIKGGILHKVPGDEGTEKIGWENVTTLRLKYLPKLEISWLELKTMFPKIEYLEKLSCQHLLYFPCDQEGVWQNSNRAAQGYITPAGAAP